MELVEIEGWSVVQGLLTLIHLCCTLYMMFVSVLVCAVSNKDVYMHYVCLSAVSVLLCLNLSGESLWWIALASSPTACACAWPLWPCLALESTMDWAVLKFHFDFCYHLYLSFLLSFMLFVVCGTSWVHAYLASLISSVTGGEVERWAIVIQAQQEPTPACCLNGCMFSGKTVF